MFIQMILTHIKQTDEITMAGFATTLVLYRTFVRNLLGDSSNLAQMLHFLVIPKIVYFNY